MFVKEFILANTIMYSCPFLTDTIDNALEDRWFYILTELKATFNRAKGLHFLHLFIQDIVLKDTETHSESCTHV